MDGLFDDTTHKSLRWIYQSAKTDWTKKISWVYSSSLPTKVGVGKNTIDEKTVLESGN